MVYEPEDMVWEPEDMVTHEIILSALGLVIAIARARPRPRSLTTSHFIVFMFFIKANMDREYILYP